ncbi:hypothetical protein [Flavisolibacter tropicus]|uniref:Ig-like domain-containing protein n=1 Tax=Flavisolibacter tropicus TaxID=1492898 RepID=A0A172U1J3_9BACT|nr:hypothetical protein [Flavisolibacter tropicus]ANE53219.1 hypothetical protein SY85_24910 [Flavisolibacter tropicus]
MVNLSAKTGSLLYGIYHDSKLLPVRKTSFIIVSLWLLITNSLQGQSPAFFQNSNDEFVYYSPVKQRIITSTPGGGNWSADSTWVGGVVPTLNDDVIILSTATITVNSLSAECRNLSILGFLHFNDATTINIHGNWQNDGFVDAGKGTVVFKGKGNALITGSAPSILNDLVIDKGNSASSIIETNGTGQISNTGNIILQNGLLKLSTGVFKFNSSPIIPSSAGIWVNGATLNGGDFSYINRGIVRITNGIANFGTGIDNRVLIQHAGYFEVSGGVVSIAGRIENTADETPVEGPPSSGVLISGGVLHISTIGNRDKETGSFHMSANSNLNINGGTIIIQNPNSASPHSNDINIISGTGKKSIIGGTFEIGDEATAIDKTFFINTSLPLYNLSINQVSAPKVSLSSPLKVENQLQLNGHLLLNNNSLILGVNAAAIGGKLGLNGGMIICNNGINGGEVRKLVSRDEVYFFPLGENTGTTEYSPLVVKLKPGKITEDAYIGVKVINETPTNLPSSKDRIQRFWTFTKKGIEVSSYELQGTFLANDIIGSKDKVGVGQFDGNVWKRKGQIDVNAKTLTISGLNENSHELIFTGITLDDCASNPPPTPTGNDQVECAATSLQTLTAVATVSSGFSVIWYDAAVGGNSVVDPILNTVGTRTYYAASKDNTTGCESVARTAIKLTINSVPTVSNANIDDVKCFGQSTGGVSVSVSGGTGTYTYLWNNGATTKDLTNVAAGTYTLTITDANGCSTTTTQTVNQPAAALAATSSKTDVKCFGQSTGGVSVSVSGGTGTYTYLWNNGATTKDLTNVAAGTYTLTITDANGCSTTTTQTVNQPAAALAATSSKTDVKCFGQSTGGVSVSVSGGTGTYTYLWNNGATTKDLTNVAAGTYTLTITDANGCSTTTTQTVNQPAAALAATSSKTDVKCFGQSTGGVSVSVSGGTGTYTYLWNNGATTKDLTNVAAGTYTLTITDANGCSTTTTQTVNQPAAALAATSSKTDVKCFGQSTGGVSVSVSGGTGTYTYLWNNGATTKDLTNVAAGTYTLTITDANGCSTTTTQTVNQPAAALAATSSKTDVKCFGQSTGGVSVSVSGGTGTYTYLWNNGATTKDLTNVAAGTYTLTITDANGCSTTTTQTVNQPAAALAATSSKTDVKCFGQSTGGVSVSVSGGTGTYTYLWNNGATTKDLTNVAAGTYTLTITDANGCSTTTTQTVNQPAAALAATSSKTDVKCFGQSTGGVSVSVSGGTGTYTYLWNNGATTKDLTNVAAGTYTLTITDANGCSTTTTQTVNQPAAALAATSSKTDVKCFGQSTGGVSVSVSGGTGTYTYLWNNGATTKDLTNVAAGTYTLTITDANGCSTTTTQTVNQPAAALAATSSKTDVKCFGQSTGGVSVSVSGGTGTYTYLWNNGATTKDLTNVAAGTYTLTITDANGCSTTTTQTVNQPAAALAATSSKTDVKCFGQSTGGVSVSVSGGTGTYTYLWNNGATTKDLTNVAAGTYTLTITDANGCSTTTTQTVNQPAAALAATSSKTDVKCFGQSTGGVSVSVSGGTGTYTYLWNNGATTKDLTNVAAGTYTLTITDANGCSTTTTQTVNQPAAALAATSSKTDVKCFGQSTGGVSVSVSGGTGTYTYLWNNGATTKDLTNVAAGTYTLTITDANGCSTTTTQTVNQPAAALAATSSKTDVKCFGQSTGGVSVSVSGGTGTYTYLWNNGATTKDLTNVAAGTYTLTITDANGCSTTTTQTVNQPAAALSVTAINSNSPVCSGNVLTLTSSGTGGTNPYSYNWSGPNGFSSTSQNPSISNVQTSATGTYTVIITDANGCTATASTSVAINQTVIPSVSIAANPGNNICAGTSVTFTATPINGGIIPSYQWQVNGVNVGTNSPTFTSNSLSNTDKVTVILTSNTVCPSPASVTSNTITMAVNDLVTPSVSISPSANNICAGSSVTFTATAINGGTNPSYQWQVNGVNVGTNSPSFTSNSLSNTDKVTVILTSNANCASPTTATSSSVTMTVLPIPVPSVTVIASSNNICPSTQVTFTATPTNGGSNPTYQWKVNGVNAGTNSSIFTSSSLNNGDKVTVVMTSNAPCASPSTATSTEVVMTVLPAPVPSVTVAASANNICPGETINFSATPVNGGTSPSYQWQVNGVNVGTNSNTFSSSTLNNGDKVTVVMTSNEPCAKPTAASQTITITVRPAIPATPGSISGTANQCINRTGLIYSITTVPNATSYTWTLPTGWSITSGQGTASITVSTTGTAVSGNITVIATNSCGSSSAQTFPVTVTTGTPPPPGVITGTTAICPTKTLTYSIEPVAGATSYNWTVPTNWSITSGQGSTSVVVQAPNNAQSGNIAVVATNVCGSSTASILSVVVGSSGSVNAGPDQTICAGTSSVILAGAISGVINNDKEWDWVITGGTIVDPSRLNSVYNLPAGFTSGSITVKLVSNQTTVACPTVEDEMVITIKPLPSASISVTGANPVCAGSTSIITFTATPNTTVIYNVNNGANQTINIDGSGTANLTTAALNSNTAYKLVSVNYTTAPPCLQTLPASAAVIVNVTPLPTVSAGGPDVVCQSATPSAITLTGASVGGSATTGAWSITSGGGTLSNTAQTNNPAGVTYTPAPGFSGIVTLTLTTNAPAPCQAISGTRTITVNPLPTVSAGGPDVVCQSATPSAITLTGASVGGSATTGAWSITSGGGTLSNTAQTNNPAGVTYTPAPGFSGIVTLTLTTNAPAPCQAISGTRTITVNPLPTVSAGAAQTICSNGTATLNGSFAGGATSATWTTSGSGTFSNNTPSAVYTPSAADISAGSVTLTYTTNDPAGPCLAVSASTLLTIKKAVVITTQPINTSVCAGASVDLSVAAVGDGLTYQWYKGTAPSGTLVVNSSNISGAQSPTLHFNQADVANDGTYYVVISGAAPCGPVTSAQRTLSVDRAITITTQPTSQTFCAGTTASFTVVANANGAPITYQWRKNGIAIPGQTGATLSLANIIAGDAGNYDVVITGPSGYTCSSATSSAASLTVNPNSTLTLTSGNSTQNICINSVPPVITYTMGGGATGISVTGLPPGMIGVFSNGVLTIKNSPTTAGTYNYTVTTTGICNNPTLTGTIIVDPAPVGGTLSPNVTNACGATNNGTITLSGQAGNVIRWESSTNGGGTWSTINNTSNTLSYTNLSQTTLYRAVIQSGVCALAYSTNSVVSVVPPIAPTATRSPSEICLGQSSNLNANSNLPLNWSGIDATFNQANPAGWRITQNGTEINFPANADNASTFPWSETNGPKTPFNGGVTYNNLQSDGKFAITSGQVITTMETPVFSTIGMTSAVLQFYQALVFAAGASGKIEISTDGGATYNQTLAQFNGPLNIGNPASSWEQLNIDLTNYLGLSNLRIRFSYNGANNSNWALDGLKVQPPGPNVIYNWTLIDPSGVASPYYLNATNQAGVTATPTAPGTYTYQVATTVGGCPGGTSNVTVVVKPLPTCDITGPSTVCPSATTTFSGPDVAGYTYQWSISGGGTISGSTTGKTVTVVSNGTCGTYTLSLITRLNNCPSTACTKIVNIVDVQAPVITLAPPGVLGCNPTAAQIAAAFGTASVSDNCPIPLTATGVVGAETLVSGCTYSSTKSWTVTDACGNTGTTTQTISFTRDIVPPVINCPPTQVFCVINSNTYTIPSPVTSDNCNGALTITFQITGATTRSGTGSDASGIFNVGVSIITWTVTDACGNSNTCTTQVTINPKPTPIIYHN